MMRRFREFPQIGGRRGGIPADCVEVQYLEGRGTQYIKTGFCPDNTSGIKVAAAAMNVGDSVVVGCRQSSNERWWVNFGSSTINISWCSYVGTESYYTAGTKYTIENNYLNSRKFTVDGVDLPTTLYTQYTLQTSNQEAYIFGANNAGTFTLQNIFRVYSCELSRGSTVERDFVPVRRVENGVSVGYMCDRLTGALYGNQGTGAFVIGPDAGLPYDYELTFIRKTDGGDTMFGTGLYPNGHTVDVYGEICLSESYTGVQFDAFGCLDTRTTMCLNWDSGVFFSRLSSSSSRNANASLATGSLNTVKFGSSGLTFNGVQLLTGSGANYNANIELMICGCRSQVQREITDIMYGKFDVYIDGVMERSYIPVSKNGAAEYYDTIHGTFADKHGTGFAPID